MENYFEESTLGNAAIQILEEVRSDDGTLVGYMLKKTDEVKAILKAQEARGANIKLGVATSSATMESMTLEAAIQAYMSGNSSILTNPLAGQPIIDRYIVNCRDNDQSIFIDCSTMKALSANVALVKQGTLSSTRIVCNSSTNQTNNKSSIKDNLVRSSVPEFQSKDHSHKSDFVVKNIDIGSVNIGAPLDFDDLYDYETLNLLIASARAALEDQTIQTYQKYGETNPNDANMYLVALRLQNRSLLDSIFDEMYLTRFPEPDITDKANYTRYISLKKRYHANLRTIGRGTNLAPYTIRMGIDRIDIITGLKQDVSSTKRIGNVKKNKVGSYTHIKPQDTGINTGVFSSADARENFLSDYAHTWLTVAGKWLENEANSMLNLEVNDIADELTAKVDYSSPKEISAAEALKIDKSERSSLQDRFIYKAYELSEKVLKDDLLDLDRDIAGSLKTMFKEFADEE